MFLTSLIADSLALGPHWVYDRAQIAAQSPKLDSLEAPMTTYHPGKQAGDQTHLGDQVKLLAQSLIETHGEPDGAEFMRRWRTFFSDASTLSYRDKATKTVLETNSPSPSTELGGVARTAPLAAVLMKRGLRGEALAAALYEHVSLTHSSAASQSATQILADLLTQAAAELPLVDLLSADPMPQFSTGDAIEKIGQSCDASVSLPVCQLLLRRHGSDPVTALRENALAGGDSAARGLFIGMILGVNKPELPAAWVAALRARKLVENFERKFD
jgi:ADP-ribosylglycohydrolase